MKYTNGDFEIEIKEDGTKIRTGEGRACFPENIDIKITDMCKRGCPMCHEGSSPNGKIGNLLYFIQSPLFESLRRGTELAIGGGNPLRHIHLETLLEECKAKGIYANVTVHQDDLIECESMIMDLVKRKLIWGVGISMQRYDEEVIKIAKKIPHSVIHVIVGMNSVSLMKKLYGSGMKLLLLGYKTNKRGLEYYIENKLQIKEDMKHAGVLLPYLSSGFECVAFDNLALKQLKVKKKLKKDIWERIFMGNDSEHTMYIDLPGMRCAHSSTADDNERFPLDLDSKIEWAFDVTRNKHSYPMKRLWLGGVSNDHVYVHGLREGTATTHNKDAFIKLYSPHFKSGFVFHARHDNLFGWMYCIRPDDKEGVLPWWSHMRSTIAANEDMDAVEYGFSVPADTVVTYWNPAKEEWREIE